MKKVSRKKKVVVILIKDNKYPNADVFWNPIRVGERSRIKNNSREDEIIVLRNYAKLLVYRLPPIAILEARPPLDARAPVTQRYIIFSDTGTRRLCMENRKQRDGCTGAEKGVECTYSTCSRSTFVRKEGDTRLVSQHVSLPRFY